MPDHLHTLAPLAVVIMGVSGSGKSTVGAELAHALSCPFLDGDTFHSPDAIAKMRAGTPLTDADRWPWLDRIASALALEVTRCGVAVAACSALKKAYRDRLRQAIAPRFVLLDVSRDELWRRLSSRQGHYMPASLLASQIDTLELPERDEQVLVLDGQQAPAVLRAQCISWLENGTTQGAR